MYSQRANPKSHILHLFMPYQKKGQLPVIVKHIKGPLLAAIRSPLTKAHDRSLEMLGLRILTSQLHSLNL